MLPRSKRLSVSEFNTVMEKGMAVHGPMLLLRYMRSGEDLRISVVAPSKLVKTAVGRNKLRRSMYEAAEELYPECISGAQAIVFAKIPAITAQPEELESAMRALFVKAGLLK